jgi:N-acyl-L-homoserine lactone synthetase
MVYAITKATRGLFTIELDSMHRDRKRVFVDRLKWNVPVVDDVYEKDQFDNENAVYIVATDADTGQHHASLRLTPTLKPHMLRDVFSTLCEDGVPAGPHIWELTRICISPSLPRELARKSLGLIWLGALEFGLDEGITTMTGLTHTAMFANIQASGIQIEPLGPSKDFDGMAYRALKTRIAPDVLEKDRIRLDEPERVLQYIPATAIAA